MRVLNEQLLSGFYFVISRNMYRLSEARKRFIAGVVASDEFQECKRKRQTQTEVRRRRAKRLREERDAAGEDADDEGSANDVIRITRPTKPVCSCKVLPPPPLKSFFVLMDELPSLSCDGDREFNRNGDLSTEDE